MSIVVVGKPNGVCIHATKAPPPFDMYHIYLAQVFCADVFKMNLAADVSQ